jgi:uncharacterized protein (DUF305 family)
VFKAGREDAEVVAVVSVEVMRELAQSIVTAQQAEIDEITAFQDALD